MLVSNFGVGIIYCFLNLLFYTVIVTTRNWINTIPWIEMYINVTQHVWLWVQKYKYWRVKSVIPYDHQFPLFILLAKFLPVEPDLLKPVIAGSGCRLLLDGLVTTPSSESGSES